MQILYHSTAGYHAQKNCGSDQELTVMGAHYIVNIMHARKDLPGSQILS